MNNERAMNNKNNILVDIKKIIKEQVDKTKINFLLEGPLDTSNPALANTQIAKPLPISTSTANINPKKLKGPNQTKQQLPQPPPASVGEEFQKGFQFYHKIVAEMFVQLNQNQGDIAQGVKRLTEKIFQEFQGEITKTKNIEQIKNLVGQYMLDLSLKTAKGTFEVLNREVKTLALDKNLFVGMRENNEKNKDEPK